MGGRGSSSSKTGVRSKGSSNPYTISRDEWNKTPKDYKGTLKELVASRVANGEDRDTVVRQYEKQGYDVNKDKTILKLENGGTVLRPVKIAKAETKAKGDRQAEKVALAKQIAKKQGFSEANYKRFLQPQSVNGYGVENGKPYTIAQLKAQLKRLS